tara:strand:+ start:6087 stop:6605 length:519 start_codon:yes stop_codon:yes gene_type:complete
MKKMISFIVLILLTLNFLTSPFQMLNLIEKGTWIKHKTEFKRKLIKTDSIVLRDADTSPASRRETSKKTYLHFIYYDKGKFISLQDNSQALFHSKKELIKTRKTLKYLEEHNDSLLIWYHPKLNGQIALAEENEMNTSGFLLQIILNILFLVTAIGSIIWLIKKINNKNEEN